MIDGPEGPSAFKSGIEKPTLLLDRETMTANIKRMAAKAARNGVVFRPHMKTHQSPEIGEIFRSFETGAITVSSVDMATVFAEAGWRDITIAFSVNLRQINRIKRLAETIDLHLLIESKEVFSFLAKKLYGLPRQIGVWIKVDTGYRRTGIPGDNREKLSEIVSAVLSAPEKGFRFQGLLTHAGQTYHAGSPEEVKTMHRSSVGLLTEAKNHLLEQGIHDVKVSTGDTPSCSIVEDFDGIDEIRPGNFVFYDAMQWRIGSCRFEDIAVVAACPVVAVHEERNEIVIYGGAVHLSKEFVYDYPSPAPTFESGLPSQESEEKKRIYGYIAYPPGNEYDKWGPPVKGAYVSALSQEHGIVKAPPEFIHRTKVGDLLYVVPIHSCLTANLLGSYLTTEGKRIRIKH